MMVVTHQGPRVDSRQVLWTYAVTMTSGATVLGLASYALTAIFGLFAPLPAGLEVYLHNALPMFGLGLGFLLASLYLCEGLASNNVPGLCLELLAMVEFWSPVFWLGVVCGLLWQALFPEGDWGHR